MQIPFAAVRELELSISGLGRLESDSLTRYRTSDIVLIPESLKRLEIQNPVTPLHVWTGAACCDLRRGYFLFVCAELG